MKPTPDISTKRSDIQNAVQEYLDFCRSLSETDWHINYALSFCNSNLNSIDTIINDASIGRARSISSLKAKTDLIIQEVSEINQSLENHLKKINDDGAEDQFAKYIRQLMVMVIEPGNVLIEKVHHSLRDRG